MRLTLVGSSITMLLLASILTPKPSSDIYVPEHTSRNLLPLLTRVDTAANAAFDVRVITALQITSYSSSGSVCEKPDFDVNTRQFL